MNKRALLGKLIVIAMVLILLLGTTLYFSFSKNRVGVTAGKLTMSFDYDSDDVSVDELDEVEGSGEGPSIEEVEDLDEGSGEGEDLLVNDSLDYENVSGEVENE